MFFDYIVEYKKETSGVKENRDINKNCTITLKVRIRIKCMVFDKSVSLAVFDLRALKMICRRKMNSITVEF